MRRLIIFNAFWPWAVCALAVVAVMGLSLTAQAGSTASSGRLVASGGGTTIVQEGTGQAGGFIPVLTTIGFHAQRTGHVVTGGFECLARAPGAATGTGSAQFT